MGVGGAGQPTSSAPGTIDVAVDEALLGAALSARQCMSAHVPALQPAV